MAITYDTNQTYFTGVTHITKDVGSGIGADAGGESKIVVDPGTGNRTIVEVTGTYGQGVGESDRFVPPELNFEVSNGGFLRIGDRGGSTTTNIKFGLPDTTDGNDAKIDGSNWKRDAAGIVEVPIRGRISMRYDSAPGGNTTANQNFLSGANSTIDLIGMDVDVFCNAGAGNSSGNDSHSHIHLGGSGTTVDSSTLGIYNTTFRFQQGSALVGTRVKLYSSNLTIEGMTVDYRGAVWGSVADLVASGFSQSLAESLTGKNDSSFEMLATAIPSSIKGLNIFDDTTTNAGQNTRQVVIHDPGATFSTTFTGVNLRNTCLYFGQPTAQIIYVDNVFNTAKSGDSVNGCNRGVHIGRRTLTGTILENGEVITSAPSMVVTQLQSDANQSVYDYDIPNSTVATSTNQAVSSDNTVTLTNPISNAGAVSAILDQYQFLHNGSNNDRVVELLNKYDYAITKFGFVPHRVANYYHGGQMNAIGDEPAYFGMYDTAGRTSYDVTGIDFGTVDMLSDAVVNNNTFTSATYTAAYRVTNWDDLYVGLHNFANIRTDVGGRGVINVSSSVSSDISMTSGEVELVNGTLTATGDEVKFGSVAYSPSGDKYRVQTAAAFTTDSTGVTSITKPGNLRLDGLIPSGIEFSGTGSGTGLLHILNPNIEIAVPTLAQSAFADCDFTSTTIDIEVPAATTRYIRFNNCTGSPVINNTGTGTLVIYNAPASATFTGTINNRTFITHTIELNEVAFNSKLSLVRWASSVSDTNLTTPGAFSNTGFTPDGDGNSLSITFDVPATSAGVAHNVWAAIYYDGYYEKAITASNEGSDTSLTALTSAELDFSIADSGLVLTTGTDLLDITVASIASATADITATLNDTTGGTLTTGWTNAVARMGIRRGIQESDQYAEALAQGFVSEEWFTWNETGITIAETGRLVYEHADSNVIFEPAGRVLLSDGTDQWRSISSTFTNRRVVFDPDAAGAKGPEIRGIIQEEVEGIIEDQDTILARTGLIPALL